ncbi:hypothetical protein TCAL_02976 [Tigriopus californicus]|uniref:Proline-rich transmembrane protein 3/4 domain-containing protein n=1 Tax=Tigriopus californicus TaxID=6832 RepID=A0A553PS17_TIGCA|nr:hypothetical protein TCAL_02976 [Tigriopus californicus]
MVGVSLPGGLLMGVALHLWSGPGVSGQNAPSSFSINSPRAGVNVGPPGEGPPPREVLVKLPDDLEVVVNLQNKDPPSAATPPPPVERVSPAVRASTQAPARVPAPVEPVEPVARSFWAIAWEAHIYFSGTLFVLLSVYCLVNIMRLHTFSRLFSRGYFIALNVSIIVIGVLRPIFLFHDPYNLGQTWPRMVGYLLLDTGYPCITTAFAVLFLALLRATQVELVSPSFQKPRSLGIFCGVHFLITIALDVTIGFFVQVRYSILIAQGFFIVWSLLLSAGYFYIFSPMKKIALRPGGSDMMRANVYPKLMMEGGYSNGGVEPRMEPQYLPQAASPPLARAIHLTLGVAIISSLMGGVQLFGMIKMLGLQKVDMSPRQNEWAWFGYQVAMRILEVTICTLLAVITTTPLRSEPPNSSPSPPSKFLLCCRGHNPPREFEDEIYSEICTNNQSVRHMMNGGGGPQGPGIMMDNPYGTLGPNGRLSLGRMAGYPEGDGTLLPMENLMNSNLALTSLPPGHSPQSTLGLMGPIMNQKRATSSSSNSNPTSTLRTSGNYQDIARGSGLHQSNSGASSRATVDTALYSNLKNPSRPSSMLFNDSGFVRFRMGDDPNLPQDDVLRQSTSNLVEAINLRESRPASRNVDTRDKLRASQSFDDSVLLMDRIPGLEVGKGPMDKLSPASQPETTFGNVKMRPSQRHGPGASALLSDQSRHSPIYKSIDSLGPSENGDDQDPELAQMYEPPPGMKFPPKDSMKGTPSQAIYSEDDMSSVYGRSQIYRPPSRCSSISATQSFDMRMYGQTNGKMGKAPAVNAQGFITHTLGGKLGPSANSPAEGAKKEKLENPYYYYGSTRNQKKQVNQKPRPLLPSQRQQLELQERATHTRPGRPTSRQTAASSRPSSRQNLLQSSTPAEPPAAEGQFQRSRSLGGYYNRNGPPPPVRGHPHLAYRQQPQVQHHQAAGSMTPISYSRWQHAQRQEEMPRRHNPLYDTPPTVRHAQAMAAHLRMEQGQPPRLRLGESAEYAFDDRVGGRLSQPAQQFYNTDAFKRNSPVVGLRQGSGLTGLPAPPQRLNYLGLNRGLSVDPQSMLSPILTDHEDSSASPMHQVHHHQGMPPRLSNQVQPDYLTDEEDSDVNSAFDQFTSQATQGYCDGLADNESEVSSIFGTEPRRRRRSQPLQGINQTDGQKLQLVSPLEYSAMLKLHGNNSTYLSKDITPDSGVNMGNNSDSNKSKKDRPLPPKRTSSQDTKDTPPHAKENSRQSLLSSSSSLNDLLSVVKQTTATREGKEYSRINPNGRTSTVFSSSSSSESESDPDDPTQTTLSGAQKTSTGMDGQKPQLYQPLKNSTKHPGQTAFRWDGSQIPQETGGIQSGGPPRARIPSEHSDLGATGDTDDFSEVGESNTEEDGLEDEDEEEEEDQNHGLSVQRSANLAF